ncbi:MAG: hypothetical protein QOC93_313 [Actinomycetota bacterium]|nr:hypothetical protein [Actinomycetota bacterium]
MTNRKAGLVLAAALLGAAAGQAVPSPVTAADGFCARGTGVTVVVDNGPLGGGSSRGCDPGGANTAASVVVPRAGFPLTYVTRQPGFVCRVSGRPAADPCGSTPPSDAYWGLFWSDGTSGRWTYSSVGVGSLKVPAGGFIGWRFQGGDGRTDPGPAPVAPAASTPTPRPTPNPRPTTTPRPTPRPTPPSTTPSTAGPAPDTAPSRPGGADAAAPAAGLPAAGRPDEAAPSAAGVAGGTRSGSAAATERAGEDRHAARAKRRATPGAASTTPSATASPSAAPASGAVTDLTASDPAPPSGSPALPLVAAGMLVALLVAVGALARRRRSG